MVNTFSEGVSLEEASVLIGRIGRAIKKEVLRGSKYRRNDVHWKTCGAYRSPAFFLSYRLLPRWSVLGRVMFMDTLHDVM